MACDCLFWCKNVPLLSTERERERKKQMSLWSITTMIEHVIEHVKKHVIKKTFLQVDMQTYLLGWPTIYHCTQRLSGFIMKHSEVNIVPPAHYYPPPASPRGLVQGPSRAKYCLPNWYDPDNGNNGISLAPVGKVSARAPGAKQPSSRLHKRIKTSGRRWPYRGK